MLGNQLMRPPAEQVERISGRASKLVELAFIVKIRVDFVKKKLYTGT